MAKKSDKGEPVGWVTVKGVHFPKWADGTIGWQEGEADKKKREYKDAVSKMAKEHVNKIMMRPTANAELYTEVKNWAKEHGMDVEKMQADAFKEMNKQHVEAIKKRDAEGKREYTDKEIMDSYKNTSTEQLQKTLHTTKLFAHSDPENARHAKIMEQVIKGRHTAATAKNEAKKSEGVTRKDVEELTAKKDSLKGVKINAKPLTEKEVKAYEQNNPFKATSKNVRYDTSRATKKNGATAEDIARDKETFRKAKEHEAKVKTKAQTGKQAIRDAKAALKQYGFSARQYGFKDFDNLEKSYLQFSKMFSQGEISLEDWSTIYNLFKDNGQYNRFFEIHNYRNRKKKK